MATHTIILIRTRNQLTNNSDSKQINFRKGAFNEVAVDNSNEQILEMLEMPNVIEYRTVLDDRNFGEYDSPEIRNIQWNSLH